MVPSVLWYCWLGLLTCKNRRPYNLYCVGGDVKPCSINQSMHAYMTKYNDWLIDLSIDWLGLQTYSGVRIWVQLVDKLMKSVWVFVCCSNMLQLTATYRDIDLAVVTSRSRDRQDCVDWLLLQSVGFVNSAAMTCGHLLDTDRRITSRGARLLLHFHTTADRLLSRSQSPSLRGFRVLITGQTQRSSGRYFIAGTLLLSFPFPSHFPLSLPPFSPFPFPLLPWSTPS